MGRTAQSIPVRLAARRDAGVIAVMSRELIEQGLGWSWTARRVARTIDDPDSNVIVATHGRRIVGFASMHYREERAHLLLLAVANDWQRRGIGSALWRWLETTALVAGVRFIHLEVRERNRAAQRFYRALGFTAEETVRGYYRGVESAVRMRCELGLRISEDDV